MMMMKSSSSTTTTSLLGGRGGVRKGAWSHEEDLLLRKCIEKYGEGKWGEVPLKAGLNRCRKSCRLRWLNYLRPNIKRGEFASDEVDLIVRMHKLLGNRWTLIAGRIPGRTANDIKNYCNTHLKEMVLSRHHHHHHNNKDHDQQLFKTAADHDHGNKKIRTFKPEAIKVLEPLPRTFSPRNELFQPSQQQQQPFEGGHGEFIDINGNSSNSNRVSTNSTSLAAAAAAAAAVANEKEKLLNSFFGDEGDMELMNNINMENWDDCDLHLDDNLWRLLDMERELM